MKKVLIVIIIVLVGVIVYMKIDNNRQTAVPVLDKETALNLVKSDLEFGDCLDKTDPNKQDYGTCSVEIKKSGGGGDTYPVVFPYEVIVIYDYIRDDSVGSQKIIIPVGYQNGTWVKDTRTVTWKCNINRGHQDFSTESCN